MRVPMVGHWLRAASGHLERRKACTTYVIMIVTAQVLWCLMLVPDLSVSTPSSPWRSCRSPSSWRDR